MQAAPICQSSDRDGENTEETFRRHDWKTHYFYFNDLIALREQIAITMFKIHCRDVALG